MVSVSGKNDIAMETNEQIKVETVDYKKLVELAERAYRSKNGKAVLYLPVQVPQNVSVVNMLEDLFEKYILLIRNHTNLEHDFVRKISETIIRVLKCYLTGDVINAYKLFSTMMDEYIENIPSKFVETDVLFYRMRKGLDLTDIKEFYHLPIFKREICSAERFSIAGYPCLYLGYSKNDCYVEVSKTGSMIGLSLNDGNLIKVLDLSFSKEQEDGKSLEEYLKAFPLIAACYVVLMNKVNTDEAKFREEYVIPQMLTSYLKHRGTFDGICYYSVRNENLNTLGRNEEDYRNLVLFPNLNSTPDYDMELMNKFHWYEPLCVR